MLKPVLRSIEKLLSISVVAIMVALVLTVSWQVVSRYFLNAPSSITEELSRFLLMWLGLLGGAYTYTQKKHLSIDLLKMNAAPKTQKRLADISYIATSLFALVLIYGGAGLMQNSLKLGQTTPTLGIPMGYVYLAVPLAGFIVLVFSWSFLTENNSEEEA